MTTSDQDNKLNTIRILAILIGIALVVPIASGAVAHYAKSGAFPIDSKAYILGVGCLAACVGFYKFPRISASVGILLALQIIRLVDAYLHHKVVTYESNDVVNEMDLVSAMIGAVVFMVFIFCLGGDRTILRNYALIAAALTILACAAANAWEWHRPNAFGETIAGRSSGWLENPNTSADAIVIMLGVVLALAPPLWFSAVAIALSCAGVYCTLSRSGALVLGLTVVSYFLVLAHKKLSRVFILVGWLIVIGMAALHFFHFSDHPMDGDWIAEQTQDRVNVMLGKSLTDADLNDTERVDVLKEAVEGIKEHPIRGYGTGAVYDRFHPHNMMVAVWLDNGVLGMILYALAAGLLVYECFVTQPALLIACIPIVGLIPFSQTLIDERCYLFCWMVAAGMLKVGRQPVTEVESHRSLSPAEKAERLRQRIQRLSQPHGRRAGGDAAIAKHE